MSSIRLNGVSFVTYTSQDIIKQSVKQVTNPQTFDGFLHPNSCGLYDNAFGPTDRSDLCGSCGLNYVHCPGHLGHIGLPLPVYHPIFFKILLQALNVSCYSCHRLLVSKSKEYLFLQQLNVLSKGLSSCVRDLDEIYNSSLSEAAYQNMGSDDIDDNIINKINGYLEELPKEPHQGSNDNRASKNSTKYHQVLIKEFLGIAKCKRCPRCNDRVRYFRSEYNSRLFLKPLGKRADEREKKKKEADKLKAKMKANENAESKEGDIEVKEEENIDEKEEGISVPKQTYLNPVEVRDHLRLVWNDSKLLLKAVFGSSLPDSSEFSSTDMFFLDVVAVPPSRFRPVSTLGEKRFENPQTANLNKVLVDCKLIYKCLKETQNVDVNTEDPGITQLKLGKQKRNSAPIIVAGKSPAERLQNAWIRLQGDVNCLMDSDLDKLSMEKMPGIRQLLEKKEGLFRKHMMGKRVNYAARSVISPDPYLNTDEIGIPEVFAKKLTYATPVTPWNCQQLRRAVMNGPNVHPGAVMIEHEDGRKVILNATNTSQREAIAKRLLTPSTSQKPVLGCKKVYRHLLNGDVLLLNRQPTLHRPSMMAHRKRTKKDKGMQTKSTETDEDTQRSERAKARILPKERTIRLHYANCKAYNADFDGDEMNAHFPQNELGRAEAYHLVSTNFNYLSPKDGKPLSGLIQDHVVSGVSMTTRNVLFTKEEYHRLVFAALTDKPGKIVTLTPCILKPEQLWSGKQLLSTIICNIIPKKNRLNLDGKSKINDSNWPKTAKHDSPLIRNVLKDPLLTEVFVIIRAGEILTGILDKSQYGSTQFGLLYGGETSGRLLSALARLFTNYLRLRGFSLGVEDILVTTKANSRRSKFMEAGRHCGDEAAASALGLAENCDQDELIERLQKAQHSNQGVDLKQLDLGMKKKTDFYQNKINSACVPHGLCKQFPDNCLQLMVQSGAKGSSVNCMQISSLLGQIELEGRRPPLMLSGRSLPAFVPYDTSPRAGGFVDGRFLTGIRPQEYFFHCMAGREGLVDTAVKTSRSGYLQRCLIKHLEGLMVQYDLTVRDSDGSVVQFLYGEDGIDVLKSQYLEQKQFPFIARNYKGYIRQLKPHRAMNILDKEEGNKLEKKLNKWKSKHGEPTSSPYFHLRKSPYLLFEEEQQQQDEGASCKTGEKLIQGRRQAAQDLFDMWRKVGMQAKYKHESKCAPCPDPVISELSPDQHFGSVSEAFVARLKQYAELNPDEILGSEDDTSALRSEQFLPLMLFKYSRSLACPGEAVGLLAGQSLGEPSTQMTLNTFHFAGRGEMNVTLGIPRLREILMTASKNIKTPTMDVLIKEGEKSLKRAEKLQKTLNRATLADVIRKIDVWESLAMFQDGVQRCRQFKVRMEFLHRSIYRDEFNVTPRAVLDYVERIFIRRVIMAVNKMCRLKNVQRRVDVFEEKSDLSLGSDPEGITEEKDVAVVNEDEEDDAADLSDDDLAGDGDAADQKNKNRQTQFSSYEEPDQEEAESQAESDSGDEENPAAKSSSGDVDESFPDMRDEDDDMLGAAVKSEEDPRVTRVLTGHGIADYCYDKKKNLWCEFTLQFPVKSTKIMFLTLVEKLTEKCVLNEALGIKRAFLSESKTPGEEGRHRLKTDGVNILELWKYPEIVELNSLYSNEIHAIANTYGIEAARKVLIQEITNVFKVYGIQIDPRHLTLVGDYMTFEGSYKPFNRQGIESNPFPLQKMTFETTTHFLREASAFGRVDTLDSPSSRLVVGRVSSISDKLSRFSSSSRNATTSRLTPCESAMATPDRQDYREEIDTGMLLHCAKVGCTERLKNMLQMGISVDEISESDSQGQLFSIDMQPNLEEKQLTTDRNNNDDLADQLLEYAKYGDYNKMKKLLKNQQVKPDCTQDSELQCQGLSALHLAARYNHVDCAKLLLEFGADVNARDQFGFRPIHDACLYGHLAILKLLLNYGARTDGIDGNVASLSSVDPFFYAAQQQHIECLQLLLLKKNNNSDADDALWDLSSKRGHTELLDFISDKGIPEEMLQKCLHNSALSGHVGFFKRTKQILKRDLSEDEAKAAMLTAVQHGKTSYVAELLDSGVNANICDDQKVTALHFAARFGQYECIERLVQAGASLEAVTRQNWTPLHVAVRQCQDEAVKKLIDLGCNINSVGGPNQETPLQLAALVGDIQVLRSILKANPDILAVNKKGKHVLEMKLNAEVKEIITEYARN
eukprot:gene10831-11982_t